VRACLLLLAIVALPSVEIDRDLRLGGYVEFVGRDVERQDEVVVKGNAPKEKVSAEANAKLNLWWQPTDRIVGVIDVRFRERAAQPNDLQQAYGQADLGVVTLRLGRMNPWFGWELFDAPDLWRVNPTYVFYNSGGVDGGSLRTKLADTLSLTGYVVNEIITPDVPSPFKNGTHLGYGSSLRWRPADGQRYKLDWFYDTRTAPSYRSGYGDVMGTSANALVERVASTPLDLGFDVAWAHNPDTEQLFTLGTVRWHFDTKIPWAITGMVTGVQEFYDNESIAAANQVSAVLSDNVRIEYALALQVWPIPAYPENRGAIEFRRVDSSVQDEDEWEIALQTVFGLP
jgi:hypothetical protein